MDSIDTLRCLEAWLTASAENGGKPICRHGRQAWVRAHGAGMTGTIECRCYGRDFTAGEMVLLRAPIGADPQPTRAPLTRKFCRRIGWLKPDGGLKT